MDEEEPENMPVVDGESSQVKIEDQEPAVDTSQYSDIPNPIAEKDAEVAEATGEMAKQVQEKRDERAKTEEDQEKKIDEMLAELDEEAKKKKEKDYQPMPIVGNEDGSSTGSKR